MPQVQDTEKDYRAKFAISQSAMKSFKELPPSKWYRTWVTKELQRPNPPSTTLGSYLDCIILTPKETEKRFVVAEQKLPSPKVQLILDDVMTHFLELNKNIKFLNEQNKTKLKGKVPTLDDKGLVVTICDKHEHYKGKGDQAYNDVLKKGGEYFEFLKTTIGKKVIGPDVHKTALELKEILFTDKVSRGFFEPKKDCSVIFQQRIYDEYEVSYDNLDFLPVKGACDILHFNHKRREVREVDLKYTNNVHMFWDVIRKFDYVGQHSFYDFLIRKWLINYKDGEFADYTVQNPLNVVIDDDIKIPYIFAYNAEDLKIKRYGVENTPITGWEDTMNDIAWHFDKQDWSRPREHQLNGFMNVRSFNRR